MKIICMLLTIMVLLTIPTLAINMSEDLEKQGENSTILTDLDIKDKQVKLELGSEKEIIKEKYDELNKAIEDLQEKISNLEGTKVEKPNVIFSGNYKFNLKDVYLSDNIDPKGAIPYKDPFKIDYDNNGKTWHWKKGDAKNDLFGSDKFFDKKKLTESEEAKQELDLNVDVVKDPLSVNLDLAVSKQDFEKKYNKSDNFGIERIKGKIEGDDFKVRIDKDLKPNIKPYLYQKKTKIGGLIAETDTTKLAMGKIKDEFVFGGCKTQELFGKDIDFLFGTSNYVDDGDRVLGVSTELELGDFKITPDIAVSNGKGDNTYLNLGFNGDLGPLTTEINYKDIKDSFIPVADRENKLKKEKGFNIKGKIKLFDLIDLETNYLRCKYPDDSDKKDEFKDKGYDFNMKMSMFDHFDVKTKYSDYSKTDDYGEPVSKITNKVEEDNGFDFLGCKLFGNLEYRFFNTTKDAYRTSCDLSAQKDFTKLILTGNIDYIKDTDEYFKLEYKKDENYRRYDKFNRSVKLDYKPVDELNLGTELVIYGDKDDVESFISTNLTPEKIEFKNTDLSPYLKSKYAFSKNNYKIIIGIDNKTQLNERAILTSKYEYGKMVGKYDVNNPTIFDGPGIAGEKQLRELGLEYKITDSVSANLDYVFFDFEDANPDTDDDYDWHNELKKYGNGNTDESYSIKAFTANLSMDF